ncbi:MAG: amino acid ABC transporter permease [Firmicutes bacterium]|nr:amino acid ABC transporter permease [Bacillota bacterium]
MSSYFTWEGFFAAIPLLLEYLPVTLRVTFISLVVATIIAVFVALIRVRRVPVLNMVCKCYLHIMRGLPYVVILLLVYYYLPFLVRKIFAVDINRWDKLVFAVIAFILHEGAYIGEILRAAVESVPKVQSEAAYSVGMSEMQTFFRIVLPQSVKVAIPAYGSNLVELFQNTTITFMIGAMDLIGRANTVGGATMHYIEPYLVVAVVYVIISILIELLFKFLDSKYKFGASTV